MRVDEAGGAGAVDDIFLVVKSVGKDMLAASMRTGANNVTDDG